MPDLDPLITFELRHRPQMQLLLERGRSFAPMPRPAGIGLGARKQCYLNAGLFVLDHPSEYLYCEGLAVAQTGGCTDHAWVCPIGTTCAVDLTWPAAGPAYYGVALDEAEVVRAMKQLETAGPFLDILAAASLVDPCSYKFSASRSKQESY